MSQNDHIVVMGGGFTGLRIAFLLKRAGYRISLIEQSDRLGGMVQTFSHIHQGNEYLFDYGPHLFFKDYLSEYRELVGEDMHILTDRFVMSAGKATLSYPLRPLEMITRLNLLQTFSYLLDFILCRMSLRRVNAPEGSLERFMANRFGQKLFDDFYAPYIEKCCGLNANDIDVLWAKERENVSGKNLLHNILNKLKAVISKKVRDRLQDANDPSAADITAWYPRRGAGQISDMMAAAIADQDILTGARVERIGMAGEHVVGIDVKVNGRERRITGDYYVSTIPLGVLCSRLDPCDAGLCEHAVKLRYRAVRLVNLIINRDRVMDALELFSMDSSRVFKRVYEPKAMSGTMAPAGKSSLCLEVCCCEGDAVYQLSDRQLIEMCVRDLLEMKLLDRPDEVEDSFVVPIPEAYPIYDGEFQEHRVPLLARINKIDNLVTCGRQGLFRYHSMTNEVMHMAESVVDFIQSDRDKACNREMGSKWGQVLY